MTELRTLQLVGCRKHGQHIVTACSMKKYSSSVSPGQAAFRKLRSQELETVRNKIGVDEAGEAWRDWMNTDNVQVCSRSRSFGSRNRWVSSALEGSRLTT